MFSGGFVESNEGKIFEKLLNWRTPILWHSVKIFRCEVCCFSFRSFRKV